MTSIRRIVEDISKCSRNIDPYDITHLTPIDQGMTSACKWSYKNKDKTIGEGVAGTVYVACCQPDDDCKYVVKVIKHQGINKDTQESYKITDDEVQREITYQSLLASHGLAPKIQEAFRCSPSGKKKDAVSYVISDGKKQTLLKVVEKLAVARQDKKTVEKDNVLEKQVIELLQGAIDLYEKLYTLGLYHGDTHLSNVMLDVDSVPYGDEDATREAIRGMQLIDFGKTKPLSNDPELRRTQQLRDIDDGFARDLTELSFGYGLLVNGKLKFQVYKYGEYDPSEDPELAELEQQFQTLGDDED